MKIESVGYDRKCYGIDIQNCLIFLALYKMLSVGQVSYIKTISYFKESQKGLKTCNPAA